MGGDHGPALIVPSVLATLGQYPGLHCQLHGLEDAISPLLARVGDDILSRLQVVHAPDQVGADEKPGSALRHKRKSSLWQAVDAVAMGQAQACVSAGNTGAMMAMGISRIGTLPGIERPAICTALPTMTGKVYLLDMGANISCDAKQLRQFAHMATAMVREVEDLPSPRVGLLNVGSEAGKGDAVVQEASTLLAADRYIHYCGFVEGDSIFSGNYDIVVCDGFVGNVALKTAEGAARMISHMLRTEIESSLLAKLSAFFAKPSLHRLQRSLNPANYNGANLLGLKATLIKSHGSANQAGFANALHVAVKEVENNIPGRISEKLAHLSDASD
jgi:phosphate acyltransferase